MLYQSPIINNMCNLKIKYDSSTNLLKILSTESIDLKQTKKEEKRGLITKKLVFITNRTLYIIFKTKLILLLLLEEEDFKHILIKKLTG